MIHVITNLTKLISLQNDFEENLLLSVHYMKYTLRYHYQKKTNLHQCSKCSKHFPID